MKFVRGRTEKFKVQFFIDIENLIPADISGATIKCIIKFDVRATDADAANVTKTVGSGITITDGPNGICEVIVAAPDLNIAQYNKAYLECVAKLTSGEFIGNGIEEVEIKGNVVKTLF